MVIKDNDKLHYKPQNQSTDDAGSMLGNAVNNRRIPSILELPPHQEIAHLKKHLVMLAAQVWQSEQLISKVNRCLDNLGQNHSLSLLLKELRLLLKEYKSSSEDQYIDTDLIVDQEFVKKLKAEFPSLSSNDLRVCSLLKLNLTTKEVATKLGISPESANKARYRIRKKLALTRKQDLIEFILAF